MPGPYDLIWCAGAVYFVGIQNALNAWRSMLAEDGFIAFSEPVLAPDAFAAAKAFWAGEGELSDRDTVLNEVVNAGFTPIATRDVKGAAWAAYYTPMEARNAKLRAGGVSAEVEAACTDAVREITLWRAAPDEIAYLLILAKPAQ